MYTKRKMEAVRSAPERKPIVPVSDNTNIINAEMIMAAISIFVSLNEHASGHIIAARPMARPMFAMLLPTTLPTISDGVPLLTTEVIASGAEDPNANTVSPITKGDIPKRSAIFFAPSTIHLEPK